MRKKIGIGIIVGVFVSVVLVAAQSSRTINYQVHTDKVDVAIQEIRGEEELQKKLTPGGYVSHVARIENCGVPCYVRAKVVFSGEKENSELGFENLSGLSEKWVLRGEYFYYTEVLQNHEIVPFIRGIDIPEKWEKERDDNNTWEVKVLVDGIQSQNFYPDFADQDPWGIDKLGIQIQKAPEGEYNRAMIDMSPVEVTVESTSEDIFIAEDQTERNLEHFLPGDEKETCIILENQSKKSKTLYLQGKVLEDSPVLGVVELTVQHIVDDTVRIVYQGHLDMEQIKKGILLGDIDPKEKQEIVLFMRLPETADNDYALQKGKIQFSLSTDVIVGTGDPTLVEIYLMTAIVMIMLILGIGIIWKGKIDTKT